MATLQLDGLRKSFGATAILQGIDLALADGEMLVIVGASGCGKSTLLRLVAGLETATAGRILLDGRDVTALDPAARDIAMVFQNYALYPHMTVAENMAYGLRIRGLPRDGIAARVRQTADLLGLGALLARRPRAAVRRAAAARGDGPRHRARAQAVPVRRAAQQPGRRAARADARRDPRPAAPAGHHQPVRHARPGGGDDAGRPAAGAAWRRAGAARGADGGVRTPGHRLCRRASSARRR